MAWMYVALCVAFSSGVVVLFRELGRRGLGLPPVIAANYLTCLILGSLLEPQALTYLTQPANWMALGGVQGSLFIGLFMLTGWAALRLGVAHTGMVVRLSMALTLVFAVVFFSEALSTVKIAGIVLAVGAVVLMHWHLLGADGRHSGVKGQTILIVSAILFVGSAIADTNFKVFEHFYPQIPDTAFTLLVFGTAGVCSVPVVLLWQRQENRTVQWAEVAAGLALGLPNYFSIHFIYPALAELPASTFFPVCNLSILITLTVVGVGLYREPFPPPARVGLALALLAVAAMGIG
jgi:drug/metabolite transporter (DMT)-like permease